MRTYDELVSAIIHAIPMREEMAALTEKQMEDLRKIGNTYDNQLYLATERGKQQVDKALGRG